MKKAFTMMELIFVIVVIGILAAVVAPRFSSNKLHEAATQVLAHIRYTQHLALMDDRFVPNDANSSQEKWQISFGSGTELTYYQVYSDRNRLGSANNEECAIDPLSGKIINSAVVSSSNMADIKSKYGVNSLAFSSGCQNRKSISFDYLGRPYSGLDSMLTSECEITLSSSEGSKTIAIVPQTGYVYLKNL